jgi:hypothetical protein
MSCARRYSPILGRKPRGLPEPARF